MDDLLNRCRHGENDAISVLIKRYRTKALDLAGALLQDEHLAQDAVQEAFLVALSKLDTLRDPDAFPGWFRQIVRTQCNRIRRRRKEEPTDQVDVEHAKDLSPCDVIDRSERHRLVREVLASLPPIGREAAEMFYLEERRCTEIGAELSVPVGTVKRRLHDARKQLRSMLLHQIPEADSPPQTTETGMPL